MKYSYDRRTRPDTKLRWFVDHGAERLKIEIVSEEDSETMGMVRTNVGKITLFKNHPLHQKGLKCLPNIDKLKAEVFKGRDVDVWSVSVAGLNEDYQGTGLGMEMYERAFKEIKPAIVIADACDFGSTSSKAQRVWVSLRRKYPSQGSNIKELAIAVK